MERKVKYDFTFKLECVKLIIEQHHSCGSVPKLKGVHESMIRMWLRFYNAYGQRMVYYQGKIKIILLILN